MLRSLIFVSIIVFVNCGNTLIKDKLLRELNSTPNESSQLVLVYPSGAWDYPHWSRNGKIQVFKESHRSDPQYDIYGMIEACHIRRGNQYLFGHIHGCIAKSLTELDTDTAFRLICTVDMESEEQKQYLEAVHLCYDQETMLLEECDNDESKNLCDTEKLITYK